MIIVKLVGGLGNQMFQYALGRTLALKHNTVLKLDLSYFDSRPSWAAPRRYELGCFDLSATVAEQRDIPPQPRVGSHWAALRPRAWRRGRGIVVIREQGYQFQPEILDAQDNSYLVGFWQTEKYFRSIEEVIRQDFTFRSPLQGEDEALADAILSSEALSLHFRRGDYQTPRGKQVFGSPPMSYYQEAVRMIGGTASSLHLFVFSDDPEWCRRNAVFDHETTFVRGAPPDGGCEDMHLMTLCKYHVIANSSFSWWGAWLGQRSEKRVFAPRIWYADPSLNTKDVIPSDWTLL